MQDRLLLTPFLCHHQSTLQQCLCSTLSSCRRRNGHRSYVYHAGCAWLERAQYLFLVDVAHLHDSLHGARSVSTLRNETCKLVHRVIVEFLPHLREHLSRKARAQERVDERQRIGHLESIPLDDDDLAEQLLLLLFAGYETTASSLSCLFRALLLHPEVMEWLQSDVMASPWPAATSPQSEKLDATVLEVMRQTPPVGGFFRRSKQAIELADVAVPENSVIQVALTPTASTGGTDLSEFRPQRHLDGSFEQTLLPFGGGERVCLGKALAELEIRLMAVGLLQKVQLQLVPDQDLALQLVPSPTPRSGLMVTASAR